MYKDYNMLYIMHIKNTVWILWNCWYFNSNALGDVTVILIIFKSLKYILSIVYEIVIRWIPQDLTEDLPILFLLK